MACDRERIRVRCLCERFSSNFTVSSSAPMAFFFLMFCSSDNRNFSWDTTEVDLFSFIGNLSGSLGLSFDRLTNLLHARRRFSSKVVNFLLCSRCLSSEVNLYWTQLGCKRKNGENQLANWIFPLLYLKFMSASCWVDAFPYFRLSELLFYFILNIILISHESSRWRPFTISNYKFSHYI